MLEFRILGPLEVVGDGGALRLGGLRQRATLAILLLNANRVVPIERLADDLYAGEPPVSAVKQVQRQVSDLRKQPELAHAIETRSPGYLVHVDAGQLDLTAFERLVAEAADADPARAAALLRQALALWHGPPLADVAYESFALAAVARLEELQLAALERRIDADLALGRHGELVGELEQLAAEHPVRERFRAPLMLALYRAGRQTDALHVYREARETLVSEFGIEPTTALQDLERRILRHDPALAGAERVEPDRSVLAVATADAGLVQLAALTAPLAGWDVIAVRLVEREADLAGAVAAVKGVGARGAAFTTEDPADDLVRLAATWDVDAVLVSGEVGPEVDRRCPADLGRVSGPPVQWDTGDGVFVPFGGREQDWAALELGAWLAAGAAVPLRLLGARAARGRRDASRLLANASIAVQQVVGVVADPLLVEPTPEALVDAVQPATVVVAGERTPLASPGRPLVLAHPGPRPGVLAPRGSATRFSWSLGG
ncbi:MAG TPA: AfsR/SARP family transcriptional regulator [Gaiellaceae bacterium]|nr:AfsR/SARP family transcriptional regulator [Gaiellaceae bacterium]